MADWYGVVSFGTKDLEWVVKYVRNQKEHHANGTTALRLESIGDESESGSPTRALKRPENLFAPAYPALKRRANKGP
jgi:hypothetical protein